MWFPQSAERAKALLNNRHDAPAPFKLVAFDRKRATWTYCSCATAELATKYKPASAREAGLPEQGAYSAAAVAAMPVVTVRGTRIQNSETTAETSAHTARA